MDGVRRAFEWLQDVPAGGGRKPVCGELLICVENQ
jgi:hypothetical protein